MKNVFKTAVENIPSPPGYVEGDYYKDGLLHCGKCHTNKQKRISQIIGGDKYEKIVGCVCQCEERTYLEEKKRHEMMEREIRIERLRSTSMLDKTFRNSRFSRYSVRDDNKSVYEIAVKYASDFNRMYKENQGLVLYGPCGTGKSFTAACIANELMDKERSVIMTSFVKVLQILNGKQIEETDFINSLMTVDLLIIDDLGTERDTNFALEKVYNVIDSRVRSERPMIITTNVPLEEMMGETDIRYQKVYDRIFSCCYPVEVGGKSFRIEEAARRFDNMKKFMEE